MERTIGTGIDGFTNPIDVRSAWQYFVPPDTGKRIVVFGHTHEARLEVTSNDRLQGCIYANSGTWIDAAGPENGLTFARGQRVATPVRNRPGCPTTSA